jgi:hypothetical protein
MKRSRLALLLTGLAILIGAAAITSTPKASAAVPKAKLMFTQSQLKLGVVRVGFTVTAEPVSVFNASGLVPAPIATATIAAPFSIGSNDCAGVTLQPAQSCSIVLLFSPTKKGKFSQPLKVTVINEKTVYKMSVSGTGSLTASTPTPTPSPTPTPTPATPTPTPAVAPTAAGDVFLLGGYASVPLIYDPAAAIAYTSGNFDAFTGGVGNGLLPENYQSVALPNGQILIAGGDDGTNAFSNAYLYDPSTQTVSPTTSMNQVRTQFTLTLLNNGQVLAVGGSDVWVNTGNLSSGGGSATLASAEIYDPPSKTWTEAAPMSVARLAHTATLMPDGTVMIVGGLTDNSSGGYALAQDYEFFTAPTGPESEGSWSPESISLLSVPRFNHSAVLLDNGSVLLVGGQGATSALVTTPVLYTTLSDFWGTVSTERTPRYSDAVTKLANGDVLVAGGINSSGSLLNTAETFSPNDLTWTQVSGTLPGNGASGQTATLMSDGRVIIAGGTSSTVATFDYSTGQFTAGGTLPSNNFNGPGSTAIVVRSASNVLPLGAGPGIGTSAAAPQSVSPNVPYTSVKVCVPGTNHCRVVDGIVADTGSSGLRLFASKLQFPETSVVGFTPLTTTSGGELGECFPFVASFTWGPVAQADIYMGGEIAKGAPIQIIDDLGSFASVPSACNRSGSLAPISSPTAPAAGFNGIMGVGPIPNDNSVNQYYSCTNGSCTAYLLPVVNPPVVPNPVTAIHNAAFDGTSTDYNGIGLTMNSVPEAGQAADYGNLTFGIGTESNNEPSSTVQVFQGNVDGSFAGAIETKFGTSTIAGYLDSGTNDIAFNDSAIAQCPSNTPPNGPWYCAAPVATLSAVNEGSTGTPVSLPVNFTVGNAEQLIQNGTYALPEVAGPFGSPPLFDWGLPFFYGRTVYVGIDGLSALINSSCGTCTTTPCSCAGPFFAY